MIFICGHLCSYVVFYWGVSFSFWVAEKVSCRFSEKVTRSFLEGNVLNKKDTVTACE